MKYKYILLIILLLLTTACNKDKNIDYDIVCTYDNSNEVSEDVNHTISRAYIYLDNDNMSKIIYDLTQESGYLINSDYSMYKSYLEMYDNIKGIKYNLTTNDNILNIHIEYDFNQLDIEEIKTKLGSMLDSSSIFNKVNKLPISYEEYKLSELDIYTCN